MSMAKVRANAIETSSKIVIADQHEDLIGGWAILSPREPNSVRTLPFEECVLLLTGIALYCVKFDWNVEKVSSFERVDLKSITRISKGVYITSTLATTQTDVERNVGFVVKYIPCRANMVRVNTRSLSSAPSPSEGESGKTEGSSDLKEKDPATKVLAFKAPPAQDSFTSVRGQEGQVMGEKDLVDNVCEEIERAAVAAGEDDARGLVENSDIISLEEARKSTGLLEQWSHSLKKMVWA